MPDDTRDLSDHAPLPALPTATMPLALQIFFNDRLFDRCRLIAKYMSEAEGAMPRHLVGKAQACFAIVSRALTWNLDPYAVAQATYQTPNGQVGYYGSLCQAVVESSGRLEGGVKFKHFGDWSAVQRKFKIETSGKGNKYPVPNWPDEAEEGVGVRVSAMIKGENEPRELEFYLAQAWPRNSTLWATDPMTQIKYTAVRRFATSVAPTLFMGVPFDRETDWVDTLKDVTPPRPQRDDFRQVQQPETQGQKDEPFIVVDLAGEISEFADAIEAAERLRAVQDEAEGQRGDLGVQAIWESNAQLIYDLRERGHDDIADAGKAYYAERIANAEQHPGNRQDHPREEAIPFPNPPEGATASNEPPQDQPASLRVPIERYKQEGKQTDWNGMANEMLEKIKTLTDPADTASQGRFIRDNREGLKLMNTGNRPVWSAVSYELAEHDRRLRE